MTWTIEEIVDEGHSVWGRMPQPLALSVTTITKTVGDLNAQMRSSLEENDFDVREVKKELGNLITTALRTLSDQRWDINEALDLAFEAQRGYVDRRSRRIRERELQ